MNNTRYLGLHFFHTESDTMTDQVGKVDRRVRQYQLVQKRTTLSSFSGILCSAVYHLVRTFG